MGPRNSVSCRKHKVMAADVRGVVRKSRITIANPLNILSFVYMHLPTSLPRLVCALT